MHADALYQRMLEQERAIEAAKAAGEAVPIFSPLLSSSSAQPPSSRPLQSSSLPPSEPLDVLSDSTPPPAKPEPPTTEDNTTKNDRDPLAPSARAALTERLKKLPTADEREVEERAATMEAKAGLRTANELARLHETASKGRKERREKGKATLGDSINAWFGW